MIIFLLNSQDVGLIKQGYELSLGGRQVAKPSFGTYSKLLFELVWCQR